MSEKRYYQYIVKETRTIGNQEKQNKSKKVKCKHMKWMKKKKHYQVRLERKKERKNLIMEINNKCE
jgi:hypothetical protein